jgi:hypothetical protein
MVCKFNIEMKLNLASFGDFGGKRKPSRLTPVSPTYQKFGNAREKLM